MMRTPNGQVHEPGVSKLKELISRRVNQFAPDLPLEQAVFDTPETVERLCLMSGGHVREMMLLMQTAIDWTDELPIPAAAVQRAITSAPMEHRYLSSTSLFRYFFRYFL
ncbi:MAG: hypothetical protein F6K19_37995 [Cyanothece sp. SIO1E1]|nr:hypothetical protein [Cyanothece sp. SIO1E1]